MIGIILNVLFTESDVIDTDEGERSPFDPTNENENVNLESNRRKKRVVGEGHCRT